MWQKFKIVCVGLLYENGIPCKTSLIGLLVVVVPLSVWAFVNIHTALTGKAFQYYNTLTIATFGACGGGFIMAIIGKVVNRLISLKS